MIPFDQILNSLLILVANILLIAPFSYFLGILILALIVGILIKIMKGGN